MEIEGGGREGERERRDKICINDRVPNLFEGRRSAKKLVDEIETKYVFRWGEIAMLVDRRREGKIISIVSTLLREEDLWRERGGERLVDEIETKGVFRRTKSGISRIIKLNRSFETC